MFAPDTAPFPAADQGYLTTPDPEPKVDTASLCELAQPCLPELLQAYSETDESDIQKRQQILRRISMSLRRTAPLLRSIHERTRDLNKRILQRGISSAQARDIFQQPSVSLHPPGHKASKRSRTANERHRERRERPFRGRRQDGIPDIQVVYDEDPLDPALFTGYDTFDNENQGQKQESPAMDSPLPTSDVLSSYSYNVHIRDRKTALQIALEASAARRPPVRNGRYSDLVLWTDGSSSMRSDPSEPGSAAVVYRSPEDQSRAATEWEHRAFGISGHSNENNIAELVAIEQALRVAGREWDALNYSCSIEFADDGEASGCPAPFNKVRIFSDCQFALSYLVHGNWNKIVLARQLRGRIDGLVDELGGRGVEVEMNWVPGHAGVAGNAQADMVAALARTKRLERAPPGDLTVWEVDVEIGHPEEVAHNARERRLPSRWSSHAF